MSTALTVADSKRAFHAAFPHVIAPIHRRMVDELLVELHLLSRQNGFQADPLFAAGLVQVFDAFTQGYRPAEQREALLAALCSATGFEAAQLRTLQQNALTAVGHHSLEDVRSWIGDGGREAPEPLAAALASIQRPDFHYSRLMAVGLLSLLQQARGADSLDPAALRQTAHELGEAMGLLRDRLDKDLALYASNLEKMAQAVELLEETVAAERRKRERAAAVIDGTPAAGEAPPSDG